MKCKSEGQALRKFSFVLIKFPLAVTRQQVPPPGRSWENSLQRDGGEATLLNMEKNFEPLKDRLRIICDRLDPEEQASFRPLIDNFTGITSEFQRIMRDLGKYGGKIGEGSTFGIYREVQNLFDQANRGE